MSPLIIFKTFILSKLSKCCETADNTGALSSYLENLYMRVGCVSVASVWCSSLKSICEQR